MCDCIKCFPLAISLLKTWDFTTCPHEIMTSQRGNNLSDWAVRFVFGIKAAFSLVYIFPLVI